MCSYLECRSYMIKEILTSSLYQLLEEIRDGSLGERASGVPDRQETVPRPRWGTMSCEGTTAEHEQNTGAIHHYWSSQPPKDLLGRTPGEVD
ncbi:hypothetical protein E2C01_050427 [Portunus trituberculatus]|uniref:Uncharacterized protein n=1 Tax=Portunus trituberculatus TaxID=210409 RepID=A0A5B7GFX2_PORTR|nr:hypothetical protein [Portunus trituberculatus]